MSFVSSLPVPFWAASKGSQRTFVKIIFPGTEDTDLKGRNAQNSSLKKVFSDPSSPLRRGDLDEFASTSPLLPTPSVSPSLPFPSLAPMSASTTHSVHSVSKVSTPAVCFSGALALLKLTRAHLFRLPSLPSASSSPSSQFAFPAYLSTPLAELWLSSSDSYGNHPANLPIVEAE